MSLDASGAVVRGNPAARALLARGDGLRLDEGRVRCVRPGADETFQRALTDASRDETPTARVLVVARANGRRPLLVFVTGVPGVGASGRGPIAVLIRDVDAQGPHAEEVLKRLFGLTSAETRLTLAIAEGPVPHRGGGSLRLRAKRCGLTSAACSTRRPPHVRRSSCVWCWGSCPRRSRSARGAVGEPVCFWRQKRTRFPYFSVVS